MNDFTLVGRQTSGTQVVGYMLIDNNTRRVKCLSKETVYRLALEKRISDVVAQEYNGKISMKGTKYKISSLPNYDLSGCLINKETKEPLPKKTLVITCKIIQGKNTVGYELALMQNGVKLKEVTLPRKRVMELAKEGAIDNARYQSCNGKDILRGVGCNINELPSKVYNMA